MSLGASDTPAAGIPPQRHSNVFERIAGVLFAPADTFRDIARKPDILAPLAILLLIAIVTSILIVPRMDFEQTFRQQMEQSGRKLSEADMEQSLRVAKAFSTVIGYTAPLISLAMFAIISGVLLLAFRLFGGEGDYKQAFSATLYSWIPLTFHGIILTIVAIARGSLDPSSMATAVMSNPAFLVDPAEQKVLFALLSSLDLFTFWTLILLSFGFAALAKMPRVRAATLVFSLWFMMVLLKVGFAALGAMASKA